MHILPQKNRLILYVRKASLQITLSLRVCDRPAQLSVRPYLPIQGRRTKIGQNYFCLR